MIDIAKLEGLASAIEEETKLPSPSHNNLGRLVGLFFRELIAQLSAPQVTVTSHTPAQKEEILTAPETPKKKLKNKR